MVDKIIKKHTTSHMFYSLYLDRRSSCDMILPNVFVDHWNECDALMILKSGYTHEVELKLSRPDYRADYNKTNTWFKSPEVDNWGRHARIESNKHDLLKSKLCFPNRFSFLMPQGLIDESEIPPYAGLMYFSRKRCEYGRIQVVRQPPLLHKDKIGDLFKLKMAKKMMWRHLDSLKVDVESEYVPRGGCATEQHF